MVQYIYYIIYYLVFPLGFISLLTFLWKVQNFTRGGIDFLSSQKKADMDKLGDEVKTLKKYQVMFVIFLLLSLPFMTFSSVMISDYQMRKETFVVSGAMGSFTTTQNPIDRSIKASFDSESIIEKMKNNPKYWHTDEILSQLDLKKLTRIPGRLAVFRMDKHHRNDIVITYTYYSPLPITKTFGFLITPEDKAALVEEDIIIYPMNPEKTDPFGTSGRAGLG